MLLVVTQGKTDRASMEKAIDLLAEANLLGVVLNKSSEAGKDSAYGSYY